MIELVRKRYKLDRNIVSAKVIIHTLEQGRRAYSIISAAVGGSKAAEKELCTTLEQIALLAHGQALLRTHQNSLRGPTKPSKAGKIAHLENHRSKAWATKIPNPIPISERPVPKRKLPDPAKPRRIPILTTVSTIPFLRYKAGPQSPKLSWALRSHRKQDTRRWNNIEKVDHQIEHGKLEDQWDDELRLQSSTVVEDEDAGWTSNLRPVQGALMKAIQARSKERKARVQALDGIVQAEKRLALQEKQERTAKRRAESSAKSASNQSKT